jgi:hypothetical protein
MLPLARPAERTLRVPMCIERIRCHKLSPLRCTQGKL